jgi:hypothetical protein
MRPMSGEASRRARSGEPGHDRGARQQPQPPSQGLGQRLAHHVDVDEVAGPEGEADAEGREVEQAKRVSLLGPDRRGGQEVAAEPAW